MDKARFIALALELPETTTFSLNESTDLRVRNKTFVSFPMGRTDIVLFKFTPDQQEMLISAEPHIFARLNQFLGRKGWTVAWLDTLDEETARSVLQLAWANVAPKSLARLLAG
jgi:hypothetical protein